MWTKVEEKILPRGENESKIGLIIIAFYQRATSN
jgi:hypothetical protein